MLEDVDEAPASPCPSAVVVLTSCTVSFVVDEPTLVVAVVVTSSSLRFVEAPSVSTVVGVDLEVVPVAPVSAIVDFDADSVE